jgi:hypothetical protein
VTTAGTPLTIELHDWTRWHAAQDDTDDADDEPYRSHGNGQPNPTLEAEWDVLHEIKWILTQLPGGKLIHTKGHQDDKDTYENLPLLSQLNVDADPLAGQYQDRFGAAHPRVLLFPHSIDTGAYPRWHHYLTVAVCFETPGTRAVLENVHPD